MVEAAISGVEAVFEAHPTNPALASLKSQLPAALVDARFDRGELQLTIARDLIREAAAVVKQSGFNFLEDVTCVDWLPTEPRFQVTYHILSHALKQRVRLLAMVDSTQSEIASIVSVWPSANFYEREVFDLFGVRFGGHPNMRRIMMPDEWEGHPLRKDYPVEGYR